MSDFVKTIDYQPEIQAIWASINAKSGTVVHIQSVELAQWTINNPFKRECSVEIIDSSGNEIEAEIKHSLDFLTIYVFFSLPMIGKAVLA